MTEIRMVKGGMGQWNPATDHDKELAKAWKAGETVKFKAQKPRNSQHHKLMFALIGLVFDNLPEQYEEKFPTQSALLTELKLQAGHYEKHETLGGKEILKPKSIAFDAMDQAAFRVFFDDVVSVVCKFFLPGVSEQQVKDEAMSMISGETL